jgi:hypothetical protein
MSWILPTALILLAGFVCIYLFCEWFVGGTRSGGDDDNSAMG